MIVGLGLDLTEISRIAALVERWGPRFVDRIFTEGERNFALSRAMPARHLAGRFAAKEATLKALRVPSGLRWHELEVVGGGSEAPMVVLHGNALAAAENLGVARMHLTISHDRDTAAAVVVAEAR